MSRPNTIFASRHPLRRRSLIFLVLLVTTIALSASAEEQKSSRGEFDCLIQPRMVLKLGTPVPGLLTEVLVDRGAVVRKGDVLAKLESGVEEAAAALAQARADNDSTVKSSRAKRDFQLRKEERAKQLRRTDNIALSAADEAETAARVAESEYEEAEVNLQLARLDLARAREVLKQRTIRSPINGVVVERKLGPGEYAFDQAHLMTVSQIDPLNVEVYVPLSQFGRIHLGNSAQVYPEVGGEYTAIVTVVDQVFDAASGTIGIRLELPNPDYALPAGLKCQIRFAGMG
jgi:RND family efflux transporter MFP subunit